MRRSTDFMQGLRKAESLVNRARSYRKRYGMRENLGYDKQPELTSYLGTLNLTYQEQCEIKDRFFILCDNLNEEN